MAGRDVKKRTVVRRFAGERAADALRENGFGRGREVVVLSAGDFSSVDWIEGLLGFTGPAHAVIAT